MGRQAFGLYSKATPESGETLAWVFTNAKDALTAFGRHDRTNKKNEAHVKKLRDLGSFTKGPNTLRAIEDSIRKVFCQDASRLDEITKCIAEDIPVPYKESQTRVSYVNAPKEMGLFLISTDELVWMFKSFRSMLMKLEIISESSTNNTKGENALKAGGGKILRPPYYIREVTGDEKEVYAGNEEDREDEMFDAVLKGVIFCRGHGIRRIKCTDKACTRGYLEHTDQNFYMNQARNDRCRECCKRRRIGNEDKHFEEIEAARNQGISHFSCKKCGEEKPIEQKASDRSWCRACCKH